MSLHHRHSREGGNDGGVNLKVAIWTHPSCPSVVIGHPGSSQLSGSPITTSGMTSMRRFKLYDVLGFLLQKFIRYLSRLISRLSGLGVNH